MMILLIRHGESEADLLNVHEGRADFELTPRGHAQAEAMAEYVKRHYTVDRIYASPLKRAAQTAGHLSEVLGKPVCFDEDLMEFNNGLLAGMPYEEAARKYPGIKDLPIDQAVYGQESMLTFRGRAEKALERICRECSDQDTAAVVTHGGMIDQLFGAGLKIPVGSAYHFCSGDTGIHVWEIRDEKIRIIQTNLTRHTEGI